MTNNDFKCWLKGFSQLCDNHELLLNNSQMKIILNHLNLTKEISHKLSNENAKIQEVIISYMSSNKSLNIKSLFCHSVLDH